MLLIHVCCADCIVKLVESIEKELKIDSSDIVLYFYNPNIHPRSEYLSRKQALEKVAGRYGLKIIYPDWRPVEYFKNIKEIKASNLNIFNKAKRCTLCWKLRLNRTFAYAKTNQFSRVSSTLPASTYQDTTEILEIGHKLAQRYAIDFYVPKKMLKNIKTKGFYKQNYCGCAYSLIERLEGKFV